jgi:drug/metabolite transporter (DMT)-like permease
MPAWVAVTFLAAFLQNMRSTLQKHLKGRMGTTGATFVRFGFGAPFPLLFVAVLAVGFDRPLPVPDARFALFALVGGATQIAATFLLVHLFSFRNFAVGTAYSRTEPAQAALFGLVVLGEAAGWGALLAIAVSVLGVMLISVARAGRTPRALLAAVFSRTAGIGLLSGSFFGLSSVAYRAASLALAPSLPEPDPLMQAGFALAVVILGQTLAMLLWIVWREPAELPRIRAAWKPALLVGLVGASASVGWFFALTLQQAAVVKAVAQVEMLFSFGSSVLVFRERIVPAEVAGCLLIVAGVLLLLLA